MNTCSGLRLRWCPLFWPERIENCCLPFYRERRLSSPRLVGIYPMTTIILFSELNTGPTSSLMPGLGFPSPGLPSGIATELLAMLYSDGTLTHWVTIANFGILHMSPKVLYSFYYQNFDRNYFVTAKYRVYYTQI